jgi:TorA maturation chaperone TorD
MISVAPRSCFYKILSLCYSYPDENFVQYAKNELTRDLENTLDKLPYRNNLEKSCRTFKKILQQLNVLNLEDWQVAYTELFIHGKNTCYPYESIIRRENRCFMGNSAISVKNL